MSKPTANLSSRLGENIRARREGCGLTQIDLAEHVDVGQALLSRIERGQKTGSLATIMAIAHALKTSVDALVYGPATDKSMDAEVTRLLRAAAKCSEADVAKLVEIAEQMAEQPDQATRPASRRSPRR